MRLKDRYPLRGQLHVMIEHVPGWKTPFFSTCYVNGKWNGIDGNPEFSAANEEMKRILRVIVYDPAEKRTATTWNDTFGDEEYEDQYNELVLSIPVGKLLSSHMEKKVKKWIQGK